MTHAGRITCTCLALACCLTLVMMLLVSNGHRWQAQSNIARRAILQALGIDSLAIQSDCDSTRTPANGACACLTDIPGGYCYHSSCDVVGLPPVLEDDQYHLSVISDKGMDREH